MPHKLLQTAYRPVAACLLPLLCRGKVGAQHCRLFLAVCAPVRGPNQVLHLAGDGNMCGYLSGDKCMPKGE
jgi:hypothetical protein